MSTKVTPLAPVSTGVTIASTPPTIPESILTTRVKTPPVAKPQPKAGAQYILTSTSKTPPPEAAKGPLDPSSILTADYSRLRIGDNKSFMEAWEEAFKLNEETTRLQNEELSSLMALKMIHSVSFSFFTQFTTSSISVALKHLIEVSCG